MIWKSVKYGTVAVVGTALLGGLLFGGDLGSYVRSSAGAVRTAVQDSVPIEFELRRARDLLDQIIPEMHANIRMIAEEEVEVAALEEEIAQARARLVEERARVAKVRAMLEEPRETFVLAGQRYDRDYVRDDLARRLERVQGADVMLVSKTRLLDARRESLHGAREMLERTRSQKVLLADRIEGLESQHRLVQAAAVGSELDIDESKIAQTQELIGEIKKRLDVAERVLAHESRFTQPLPVDTVSEEELLSEVDAYLADSPEPAPGEPGDVRVSRSDD